MKRYSTATSSRSKKRKLFIGALLVILLGIGGWFAYWQFAPSQEEKVANQLQFDGSVTESEKAAIQQAITGSNTELTGSVQVSIKTTLEADAPSGIVTAYVPVTEPYAVRQNVATAELAAMSLFVSEDTDPAIQNAIAEAVGVEADAIKSAPASLDENSILFMPADQLSPEQKLLQLNGTYYLDSFVGGAVFRQVVLGGEGAEDLANIKFNTLADKDTTLKVNTSGVTALTRLMMRKLNSVGDPTFFSAEIGDVLADADITHVSNEVSFQEGCQYSNVLFCSPPEFIETLKDSGVDLVELTGNHNNDKGSTYNTKTIELYQSLGMATFGGGINSTEAAKPYIADKKGSKVAFIGYNMADGAGSGAIADDTTAGANFYTDERAKAAIDDAKQNSQFVVVHIQYAECQAYPAGYVEFPECDGPISGQQEDFRKLIDFGADMVVGSSAHQPQTYEFYNGKPIYYGLGNLYFEQTQWPGTERGIILSSYFVQGKLVQTKLLPTVYDKNYQTRLMNAEEAEYLLDRLRATR